MKISNVRKRNPILVTLSSVKFGSLIRIHEAPNHWPTVLKNRQGRFSQYFMVTSEYYRPGYTGQRQMLVVDVTTGTGVGVIPNHRVEIIHSAEVVLDEN